VNKELRIAYIKQACDDIKNLAEEIVGSSEYTKYFTIEITFDDGDSGYPTITINKEFPVTFSDEIKKILLRKGTTK